MTLSKDISMQHYENDDVLQRARDLFEFRLPSMSAV